MNAGFVAGRWAVETWQDVNTFVVVLAENPDGSGRLLMLQRSMSMDDQDRRLGFDNYCICNADGASVYGGILQYSMGDGRLQLQFEDSTARTLGFAASYVIDLPFDRDVLAQIDVGIRQMIGGGPREA